MVYTTSNTAPNGDTLSAADNVVLSREWAVFTRAREQNAKFASGEVILRIGDEFTEQMTNATATFKIVGFMSDGRVGVRLAALTGIMDDAQQEWLHVKRCGDLAVWMADSVASRFASQPAV